MEISWDTNAVGLVQKGGQDNQEPCADGGAWPELASGSEQEDAGDELSSQEGADHAAGRTAKDEDRQRDGSIDSNFDSVSSFSEDEGGGPNNNASKDPIKA